MYYTNLGWMFHDRFCSIAVFQPRLFINITPMVCGIIVHFAINFGPNSLFLDIFVVVSITEDSNNMPILTYLIIAIIIVLLNIFLLICFYRARSDQQKKLRSKFGKKPWM